MKIIAILSAIGALFNIGLTAPLTEELNDLSERSLHTCIRFEGDITGSNSECSSTFYTDTDKCNVLKPGSSLSSVSFSEDMRCTLFVNADCSGPGDDESLTIPFTSLDLNKVGWTDRATCFSCKRLSASPVDPNEKIHVLDGNTSGNTTISSRDLGTCVDFCDGPDATGNCARNVCSPPGQCEWITFGWSVESFSYSGATHCEIWSNYACNGDNWKMPWAIRSLSLLGWGGGRVKSFACWRPF
jgi:hypothetical protein